MPHSRASLMVLPADSRRLDPPAEFTEGSIERRIFMETVASVPPDHFTGEDRVLLAEYCRTAALARRASEELAVAATVGAMASPWLNVHQSATKTMLAFATRLRLGPRARSHNVRKTKRATEPSYYELMALGAAESQAPQRGPRWPPTRR